MQVLETTPPRDCLSVAVITATPGVRSEARLPRKNLLTPLIVALGFLFQPSGHFFFFFVRS